MSILACHHLSRRFGDLEAVSDLSFEVTEGEFFALLGPNGAGKSTTLHMLTTVLRPTSGTATVAGHDVVKEARAVRAAIGMVFQEPALDDRLSARENLAIHAALYRLPRARVKGAIDEALAWASLADAGSRIVRTFSGGMKRRLELSRALMHHPALLFLDEPTVGLDPQGRNHLWESLASLRERGLTVIMTTHTLAEAESCDRVGIIDGGKLIALGSPDALRSEAGLGDDVTLEDVFLTLTGRALRDEAGTARDRLLSFAKHGGEHTR